MKPKNDLQTLKLGVIMEFGKKDRIGFIKVFATDNEKYLIKKQAKALEEQ
jgi:hypothetical protein